MNGDLLMGMLFGLFLASFMSTASLTLRVARENDLLLSEYETPTTRSASATPRVFVRSPSLLSPNETSTLSIDQIRLGCLVFIPKFRRPAMLLSPERIIEITAVRDTWGRRCDDLVFVVPSMIVANANRALKDYLKTNFHRGRSKQVKRYSSFVNLSADGKVIAIDPDWLVVENTKVSYVSNEVNNNLIGGPKFGREEGWNYGGIPDDLKNVLSALGSRDESSHWMLVPTTSYLHVSNVKRYVTRMRDPTRAYVGSDTFYHPSDSASHRIKGRRMDELRLENGILLSRENLRRIKDELDDTIMYETTDTSKFISATLQKSKIESVVASDDFGRETIHDFSYEARNHVFESNQHHHEHYAAEPLVWNHPKMTMDSIKSGWYNDLYLWEFFTQRARVYGRENKFTVAENVTTPQSIF